MSLKRGSKAGPGAMHVCIGLLAVAGGALGVHAQRVRVFCRFVSATRTRIQYEVGYAEALVGIAESICSEAAGQPVDDVLIDESISAVAAAQAEAVASVVGTCAGDATLQLQVRARRRAEAQASAVGAASANIVATLGVCDLCEVGLQSFAVAMETLTVAAVADVDLEETVQCNGRPLTVGVVQQLLQADLADRLSTAVDDIRSSAADGCSTGYPTRKPSNDFAVCDVAISADDIITEIDAVADAGLEVQGFGCDGVDSFLEVELKLREVATAVAQAVTQASTFCETNGGPGTMACGLSRGTIDAVARATATAFVTSLAEAYVPECDCDVGGRLDAEEMETIIAEASASSLAEVCVNGVDYASAFDFQTRAEERVAEAIAEAFAAVYFGTTDCGIALGLTAAPAATTPAPSFGGP